MIYLDSCALVKLVRDEDDSVALQSWLDERPDEPAITSELARTELLRVIRRNNHTDQGIVIDPDALAAELAAAAEIIDGMSMLAVTTEVLDGAGAIESPMLRTLDAIHLASATELDPSDLRVVTYDRRLAECVRAAGLKIEAPR
ncbi:MAG: type II toxin-antitoxin system VapC family toxin [Pseudonocardia sp.]